MNLDSYKIGIFCGGESREREISLKSGQAIYETLKKEGLNVVKIEVPPLRDRKDDIPLLSAAFLKEFNEENEKNIEGFSSKVRSALYNYSWPGNIRELRNCIESSVVLSKGSVIELDDLPLSVTSAARDDQINIPLGSTMETAEKEFIIATLNYCKGNKSKTAEMLEIGRKTLHRKIQDYQIESK